MAVIRLSTCVKDDFSKEKIDVSRAKYDRIARQFREK